MKASPKPPFANQSHREYMAMHVALPQDHQLRFENAFASDQAMVIEAHSARSKSRLRNEQNDAFDCNASGAGVVTALNAAIRVVRGGR